VRALVGREREGVQSLCVCVRDHVDYVSREVCSVKP
jgi:hypothetical protein